MSMTRGSLLGQDPSRRGSYWHGLFACHGAHGAGACRALCIEAEFRHRGSPGTMLAPVFLKDKEQQQQHILPPASAQRHAYHCSICGAIRQTHRRTRMRTHARTCIQTNTLANKNRRAHAHTHAHAQTHRHTRAHIHTHKHTDTHMRTHTYTHTCTHTRAHTH